MARSPAHRFGQIVGEILEVAIAPMLEDFAREHGLYLDRKGARPCRSGKKCSWIDLNGNAHDLDFVLERGGTTELIGTPAAFIETAWRRYTKHSRNKAQEIQGALEPLAETYRNACPFRGVVLAGVFTENALSQLRSLGFSVLYFPYESVIAVFKKFGIDAASTESTPDAEFQAKVDSFERLSPNQRSKLAKALMSAHAGAVRQFRAALNEAALRQIERIVILALHGTAHETATVHDAICFIEEYRDDGRARPVERYEIHVRYNNGNAVTGSFKDKTAAVEFLRTFEPVIPKVK